MLKVLEKDSDDGATRHTTKPSARTSPRKKPSGHSQIDTQKATAGILDDAAKELVAAHDDGGHVTGDPLSECTPIIQEIIEQWRRRQNWHRAEKSLTLQTKAMCRRFVDGSKTEADKLYKEMLSHSASDALSTTARQALACTFPLLDARATLEFHRGVVEKHLKILVKQLPAWEWVSGVRGFAEISFAGIVGEAGDLAQYDNPAKLWKRFGLGLVDGERQRKCKDAIKAKAHGYSPRRRAIMWNLGDSMIKTCIRNPKDEDDPDRREALSEYGQLYLDRKAYETPKTEYKAAAHARAKRYMEKRLLRDLWRAWRGQGSDDARIVGCSAAISQ